MTVLARPAAGGPPARLAVDVRPGVRRRRETGRPVHLDFADQVGTFSAGSRGRASPLAWPTSSPTARCPSATAA